MTIVAMRATTRIYRCAEDRWVHCLAGRLDWLSGIGQVDVWIEGYFVRPYIQCVGFDVCCRKGMAVQFFRSITCWSQRISITVVSGNSTVRVRRRCSRVIFC